MILAKCDYCGSEIYEKSALLLSPLEDNNRIKYHICKKCYGNLMSDNMICKNHPKQDGALLLSPPNEHNQIIEYKSFRI